MQRKLILAVILLGLIGLIDAIYLTAKFYAQSSVFCSLLNNGCDLVTSSRYASFWEIPIALVGIIYYALIIFLAALFWRKASDKILSILRLISTAGFLFSLWLLYLQVFVIKALCLYCIISAVTSTLIFIISLLVKNHKTNYEHKTY